MLVDGQHIDSMIKRALSQWRQPGLAISIVNQEQTLYQAGFGVCLQCGQKEINEHTIFGIGSCTKPFAAATVALLVDEGQLTLDDKIKAHLPEFQLYDPRVTDTVTIRDLLCMRTGITSGEGRHRHLCTDRADYIRRLRYHSPIHEFRVQFSYWTDGFTVLAELVSKIVEQPWEKFVQARIWEPLGMNRTNANHRTAILDGNCAAPHDVVSGKLTPIPWLYEDHVALAAGGVNSSTFDLSKWLQFVLRAGTINNRRLLSAEILRELLTPHTAIYGKFAENEFSSVVGDGPLGIRFQAYALGWYVHDYRGHTVIYHTGKIDGFQAVMGVLPDDGVAICVLINSSNYRMQIGVFQSVVDSLLGIDALDWNQAFLEQKLCRDLNDEEMERRLVREKDEGISTEVPFYKYVGDYADCGCYGQLNISVEDKCLIANSGTTKFMLAYWRSDCFEVLLQPPHVVRRLGFARFQVGGNGSECVLHWWDGMEFQKIGPDNIV